MEHAKYKISGGVAIVENPKYKSVVEVCILPDDPITMLPRLSSTKSMQFGERAEGTVRVVIYFDKVGVNPIFFGLFTLNQQSRLNNNDKACERTGQHTRRLAPSHPPSLRSLLRIRLTANTRAIPRVYFSGRFRLPEPNRVQLT